MTAPNSAAVISRAPAPHDELIVCNQSMTPADMTAHAEPMGEPDPAAARAAAIAEFQQDHHDSHALEPTGELDEGTAGALEEVHGS